MTVSEIFAVVGILSVVLAVTQVGSWWVTYGSEGMPWNWRAMVGPDRYERWLQDEEQPRG